MTRAFEAWRKREDRPDRFEGSTPAAAVKVAWKASGVGTRARFRSWLVSLGLWPFKTGKGYVLNIPHGPAHKLTADGKNTY